jgi:hypothetical protein
VARESTDTGDGELMIRVEVILENSVEIWNLPSIPNLPWTDNNLLALQIVYDDLIRRSLCLDKLQISAQDLEFRPVVPVEHCLWCLGTDHLLEQCAEKHNLFALTRNDEQFLNSCGVWYPRWIENKFVSDPYESEVIQ